MKSSMLVLLLLAPACKSNDARDDAGAPDMAVAADLAVADLAIATLPDFGFGTNTDGASACAPTGGSRAQYVWNAIALPQQRQDYAIDLNGDGRVDNQLGNIYGALAANNLSPQMATDQAIAGGQAINLLDERSTDATFAADGCAASTLQPGLPQMPPDYSGAGHFSLDPSQPPGNFSGPIVASQFTSEPPPSQARVPVVARVVGLGLIGANVDIIGARITYRRNSNGTLAGGQLNGAIRKHDVDTVVVPNVAATLNAQVQANPTSPSSMQILTIFDNGGAASAACGSTCQNPDGSCAKARDNKIDVCEVATNNIIRNVLAPDVQMFDAAGNYHPNPLNTNKDSLSLGIGFTAVPAIF